LPASGPDDGAVIAKNRSRIGLLLNQEEEPGQATPRWSDIEGFACDAEAVGIDSLWVVDHFLWESDPWGRDAVPGAPAVESTSYGVWEAWTMLAAVAAATERVRLGTLVSCTGYRNPALLAKMAATVDEISGGRLVLGLGAGDAPGEHRRLGLSYDRPIGRFAEALAIIVPLLRTGSVDFDGQTYQVHCELRPRGPRPGGPPILIGSLGNGPRVLRLVAEHADVWNGWITDRSRADQIPALRTVVDAACLAQGRDPITLERSVSVAVAYGDAVPGAIHGTAEEIADSLRSFAAEGIHEIQVRLLPNDRSTLERFGRALEYVKP
jgi:alkanesulfonate monooxygenase SsuD/methylene tetrahydromethanopterin reductase-like flavin-dependent oxidoreductase (luciferase family)